MPIQYTQSTLTGFSVYKRALFNDWIRLSDGEIRWERRESKQ